MKTKIIILEGENCTGKTTISDVLVKKGFNYIKCSQPKEDPYIEYMKILQHIEENPGRYVIDRFYYGEFVYGPIYRGESRINTDQFRNIELKALSMNTTVIYCYDDCNNIKDRFKTRGEEFATIDNVDRTLYLFSKAFELSLFSPIKHKMMSGADITKNNILEIISSDEGTIQKFKTAVGNTINPAIILVGEKRNENQKINYKKYSQPFDFGPSSKFLFKHLKKAKIPLNDIMIINSDSYELEQIKKICAQVVALGSKASDALSRNNVAHYQLNHPQYENRFNYNSSQLYKQLKDIYESQF